MYLPWLIVTAGGCSSNRFETPPVIDQPSNCRLNEQNVFPRPEVHDLLREYERVQLYTDEVPEELYTSDPGYRARRLEAMANDEFKAARDVFGTKQLPLYVVLVPQGGKFQAVVYPEGAINKPGEFVEFLKAGLGRAGQ